MQVPEQDLVERKKVGQMVEAIAAGSRVKLNAWRGRRRCQAKYKARAAKHRGKEQRACRLATSR
jgi:hypothetical protein